MTFKKKKKKDPRLIQKLGLKCDWPESENVRVDTHIIKSISQYGRVKFTLPYCDIDLIIFRLTSVNKQITDSFIALSLLIYGVTFFTYIVLCGPEKNSCRANILHINFMWLIFLCLSWNSQGVWFPNQLTFFYLYTI